jgi:hypothetical protein
MALILFAIGLGYLQAGSNLLQRDMSGSALNRPLYANGSASPLPHYAIAVLAWPLIRMYRGRCRRDRARPGCTKSEIAARAMTLLPRGVPLKRLRLDSIHGHAGDDPGDA